MQRPTYIFLRDLGPKIFTVSNLTSLDTGNSLESSKDKNKIYFEIALKSTLW